MPTKDIGGGNVLVDFTKGTSPLETAKDQLGLVDLANRIRIAPTEQRIKEQELAIKDNEARQIPIRNAILEYDRRKGQAEAAKGQMALVDNELKEINNAFSQNFEIGHLRLRSSPVFGAGAEAKQNPDGTVTALMMGKAYTIPGPGMVVNPELKAKLEGGFRDDFTKATGDFKVKSEAYHNVAAKIGLATGTGDIATLINLIKLEEPGAANAVREGEALLYSGSNPLVQQWVNLGNSVKWNSEGKTLFGSATSPIRKQILKQVKGTYERVREQAISTGQTFREIVGRHKGLDARNVLIPPGTGITQDDFFPKPESLADVPPAEGQTVPAAVPAPKAQRPDPREASVLPTGEAPAAAQGELKYKTPDELIRARLFKGMFPKPQRRGE